MSSLKYLPETQRARDPLHKTFNAIIPERKMLQQAISSGFIIITLF